MQVQLVGLVGRTMHMPGTGLDPCLVCVARTEIVILFWVSETDSTQIEKVS
eukprot:COSAG04_NODE_12474_length_651_cov_0.740942_1_plen_50_part_10